KFPAHTVKDLHLFRRVSLPKWPGISPNRAAHYRAISKDVNTSLKPFLNFPAGQSGRGRD
ncbi:MAG: hypothetical protein K0M70_03280, partial [Arenimonas sp.]|uniref:hypothetical protein n=1 Tax=Arenimonas sp. TaxID=1872635 RepID=UPI0025C0C59E